MCGSAPITPIWCHNCSVSASRGFQCQRLSGANKDLDYISSVLVYKRPMMKLIPMYPIQAEYITDLFDENNSHKSVRELTTLFKNRIGEQDKFFQNWLRVAAVAKDFTLTNNADSTSQLQLGPGLPHAFTLDHSEDIYADLRTGFKDNNQEFGTTVANGVLNCLSKEFDPALKEIVDVDAAREVRQRTGTSPGVTTTNDSTLDAVLQRNLQLEEQLAQRQRFAALATSRQQAQTTARIANGNVSFEGIGLPFSNKINQFSGNGFSNDSMSTFQQPASTFQQQFGTSGATNPFGDASLGTPGHPGPHSAPAGIGTNASTSGATTGNGFFSFGAEAPYTTDPQCPSPHQSIGDQLQAMLNRSDQGRTLTAEDMNRFELLKFLASEKRQPRAAKPDQPKKDKDNLGTRAFNSSATTRAP